MKLVRSDIANTRDATASTIEQGRSEQEGKLNYHSTLLFMKVNWFVILLN